LRGITPLYLERSIVLQLKNKNINISQLVNDFLVSYSAMKDELKEEDEDTIKQKIAELQAKIKAKEHDLKKEWKASKTKFFDKTNKLRYYTFEEFKERKKAGLL